MNKGKMVCTVAAQKCVCVYVCVCVCVCVCVYACVHPCMCMCERDDGDDTLLHKDGVRERESGCEERERQTDWQTERQTDRQMDGQTDREKFELKNFILQGW